MRRYRRYLQISGGAHRKRVKRCTNLMSWQKLCRYKENGGLSFREISTLNQALLAKQWWRLIRNPNSMVDTVYKARYCRGSSFLNSKLGSRPSAIWRSLLWGCDMPKWSSRWKVGNGNIISIYNENWLPRPPFKVYSPKVLPETARVNDHLLIVERQGVE